MAAAAAKVSWALVAAAAAMGVGFKRLMA